MNEQGKIESTIELPYQLIEMNNGSEQFILQFNAFDNLTEDYIKWNGVTGKFSVIYRSPGMKCHFGCDVTVGNVYDFYIALDTAYDLLGNGAVAVLKNYGDVLNRTNLTIQFNHKGHCSVEGYFKNKGTQYRSGISFSFELDQTYITEILISMEKFFEELGRIQGNRNFY